VVFQITLTILTTFIVYNYYTSKINEIIKESNAILANDLSDTFKLTNEFLSYIGKQILKGNYNNPNYIFSILKDVEIGQHGLSPNAFSWSCIDWVNNQGFQTVNQREGIRQSPKDMNERSYISDGKINPWKIQFSKPTVGYPSGIYVIPAGIGVTTSFNQLIGYLVVGFSVDKLIESSVTKISERVSFQITDEKGTIIFSDTNKDNELLNSGHLNKRAIPNTPYQVSTFIRSATINKNLIKYIIIVSVANILISISAWLIIVYVKNRMLMIAKLAESADKILKQRINNYILMNTNEISNAGHSLLNLDDSEVSSNDKMLHLISIVNAIDNIKQPSPHLDSYQTIDVNTIVQETLDSLGNILVEKNINLKTSLDRRLPNIHTDSFCIRLLISGFFFYILDSMKSNGKLEVKSSTKLMSNLNYVLIEISGGGFGLDPYTMDRIKNNLFSNSEHSFVYRSIKYLINLAATMECFCSISPECGVKTSISILIPVETKKPLDSNAQKSNNEKSNVIPFKPKQ
jgi:hypothetical protein